MSLLISTAVLGAAALLLPWLWGNVVIVGRRLWATRNIPEPPGSLLLGHIPQLVGSNWRSFRCFHEWSLKWPVFRIRFFGRPVVVVTDPDLYQPLLRKGPSQLPKYTAPYKMFEIFTNPQHSNILSAAENATWKAVRQAAVSALTMNNLRLCFPHITAVTQRLIDTLSAAGPSVVHDMDAVAAAITVDVIGVAAFNRDLQATCTLPASTHSTPTTNTTNDNTSTTTTTSSSSGSTESIGVEGSAQAAKALSSEGEAGTGGAAAGSAATQGIGGSVVFPHGHEVLHVIGHLVVAMQGRNNPLNRWFPWRKAYKDMFYWGGRMSGLVRDLADSMDESPPPPHSLGAQLLKAKYSTGRPLERNQILAEIGIMWGAGYETTAHTICWTLFLLATHPEAESKLCAELDSLGLLATPDRPRPAPMQWEQLAQLKYLSAVINESMRMYPVTSSGTIRITDKPITLAGHSLPAGQPVLLPFYAIHRSPRLWQDPDSFRPERFLASHKAQAQPTAAAGAGRGSGAGAVSAGGGASAGGSIRGIEGDSDEDYVDVAADLAADTAAARDQDQREDAKQTRQLEQKQQQQGQKQEQTELKDPTVDCRGFMPFSIGTRNCVGQALALVELKAVLATLVGTFSFSLHPSMGGFEGVDASAKQTVTLRPEHGLLMTLTPRAGAA